MSAIELYTKILEVIGKSEYADSSIAVEFVQRKINNDYYARQQVNSALNVGTALPGYYPAPSIDCQAKAEAAARDVVRGMIREELAE